MFKRFTVTQFLSSYSAACREGGGSYCLHSFVGHVPFLPQISATPTPNFGNILERSCFSTAGKLH